MEYLHHILCIVKFCSLMFKETSLNENIFIASNFHNSSSLLLKQKSFLYRQGSRGRNMHHTCQGANFGWLKRRLHLELQTLGIKSGFFGRQLMPLNPAFFFSLSSFLSFLRFIQTYLYHLVIKLLRILWVGDG